MGSLRNRFRQGGGQAAYMVTLSGGDSFDPVSLGQTTGCVLCLARQAAHPGIKDYAETLDDDVWTDADIASVDAAERGSLYLGSTPIYSGQQDAALHVTGEARWELGFDVVAEPATKQQLLEYAGSGETEADNILYQITVGASQVGFFCESGAGDNHGGGWQIPGRLKTGERHHLSIRRDASDVVTCYLDGVQLKEVYVTEGVTDDSDGGLAGAAASGGSAASLEVLGAAAYDQWLIVVGDDTFGEDLDLPGAFDTSMLVLGDEYATLAADPDAVLVCQPTSSGWTDLVGTVADGQWNDRGNAYQIVDAQYWVRATAEVAAVAMPALRITGALTIEGTCQYEGSLGYLLACGASGETEDTNYLYSVELTSTTTLRYFHESGVGANHEVVWTIPTIEARSISRYKITRGAGGVVQLTWDGEIIDVTSTSGTNNGSTATIAMPTGGSTTRLFLGSSSAVDRDTSAGLVAIKAAV